MEALSPVEAADYEHERRRRLIASAAPQAQDEVGAELVLAADQFIITPAGHRTPTRRGSATKFAR